MSEDSAAGTAREQTLPPPSFQLLAAQFATQALVELGEIPNPISGGSEVSLPRARYTLDMLQILKDKTEGNLTPEELSYLEAALYELRMKFVDRQKDEG